MRFSERIGVVPVSVIQTAGMSEALRNSLWNVLDQFIWGRAYFVEGRYGSLGEIHRFSNAIWSDYFKRPLDTKPKSGVQILNSIRQYFFSCRWNEVYDLIEFILKSYTINGLEVQVNQILERELSGFRAINGTFTPVTEQVEREAIELALAPGPYAGARTHLQQALALLANREKPDYRNSIKESISAIESIACELSGKPKATLGDALKALERNRQLHASLKIGFSAIYGYVSDEDGIRHKMMGEPNLDLGQADAKFFLVSSAAFVNYLKEKLAKPA